MKVWIFGKRTCNERYLKSTGQSSSNGLVLMMTTTMLTSGGVPGRDHGLWHQARWVTADGIDKATDSIWRSYQNVSVVFHPGS